MTFLEQKEFELTIKLNGSVSIIKLSEQKETVTKK